MSGQNNQGPPTRLTPVAGDMPIGRDASGAPIAMSFEFFQCIQRILSYLGQPGQGNPGGAPSSDETVAEQLDQLQNQVANLAASPGTAAPGLDGRISMIESLLRRMPWLSPGRPRKPRQLVIIPAAPQRPPFFYPFLPPPPPTPGGSGTVTNIATTGPGITGGPITGTGTLAVEWNSGTVTALGPNLAISSGTLDVIGNASGSPVPAGAIGEIISADSGGYGQSSTITFTLGSPGVINWTAHGITGINAVQFSSTGAFPTGISALTTYYAVPINANSFHIATSIANAIAGTFVNLSGSPSGTPSCYAFAAISNGANFDVAAIQVTEGIWEIHGGLGYNTGRSGTGSATALSAWVNTSSVTVPNFKSGIEQMFGVSTAVGPIIAGLTMPLVATGLTTVYLSGVQSGGSNWGAFGTIYARRVG